jgi:hypothetical protein
MNTETFPPGPVHHVPSTSFSHTDLTTDPLEPPSSPPDAPSPPSKPDPHTHGKPPLSSTTAATGAAQATGGIGSDLPRSSHPTPAPSALEGPTTSASTGAVTPSARPSTDIEEADGAAGAWWLPQPQPHADPNHIEWRPGRPLVTALSCPLCNDLLKEAISAPACGHSCKYSPTHVSMIAK